MTKDSELHPYSFNPDPKEFVSNLPKKDFWFFRVRFRLSLYYTVNGRRFGESRPLYGAITS